MFISKPDPDRVLESVRQRLKETLGANLHSLSVYGSYVRGGFRKGKSDLNLMIVLNESTAAAHQAIAAALSNSSLIEPFIIEKRGFERTVQLFALKFASIKRNCKVLEGADPFAGIQFPAQLLRMMSEQSLRNLELRLTHAFVVGSGNRKLFSRRLSQLGTSVFVDLSEVARLSGAQLPNEHPARIPVLEKTLGRDLPILARLLELKARPRTLPAAEIVEIYAATLAAISTAIRHIESEWRLPSFSESRP